MSSIKIRTLGIGALKIWTNEMTCVVDAFIDEYHQFQVFNDDNIDIILITHDDGDHFSPFQVANNVQKTNAIVVGPPSITYPLLVQENLPSKNLKIIFHPKRYEGVQAEIKRVPIKVYNTEHFLEHYPVHISFLIEIEGKRIYISGDSNEITEKDPQLKNLDLLILNFVKPEKNISDISIIKDIINKFQPKKVLINHLLNCDWTFTPSELKREIESQKLNEVVILENRSEILEL
ncbi:MAG: MBL fold metallo-hydrolase [Candidatus Lokiarchaeota archaeon]|nr:MBL fold metallo-hydrolase [Candidatus Lokiarchaeota archaeon]